MPRLTARPTPGWAWRSDAADYAKPEGFCDEAWKAVYQYAFALAHGAGEGLFYYGDWIRARQWPFAAATTACGPLSSSWRPRTRNPLSYTLCSNNWRNKPAGAGRGRFFFY